LRAAAPLDAPPLQDEKANDHHDRIVLHVAGKRGPISSPLYSPITIATAAADRKWKASRSSHDNPHIRRAAPRKIVLPAAARNGRAKFGHGRSSEKRVESAHDPNAKKQIDVRQPLRDVARARTIPAAIVLPTAADMPNTCENF